MGSVGLLDDGLSDVVAEFRRAVLSRRREVIHQRSQVINGPEGCAGWARGGHGSQRQRRYRLDWSLRRRPRIESRNDEKKIWIPTMISVAARTAMRSSESTPKPW